MEQSHKVQLEQMFPFVRAKSYRLGHYCNFDIADPYRQSIDQFEAAYAAIAQGVANGVRQHSIQRVFDQGERLLCSGPFSGVEGVYQPRFLS